MSRLSAQPARRIAVIAGTAMVALSLNALPFGPQTTSGAAFAQTATPPGHSRPLARPTRPAAPAETPASPTTTTAPPATGAPAARPTRQQPATPAVPTTTPASPAATPAAPEQFTLPARPDTTTMIPCSTRLGMPTGRCSARISVSPDGAAQITATRADGSTRTIRFSAGQPDAQPDMVHEQRGDLWVVEFNRDTPNAERYEIQSALIR